MFCKPTSFIGQQMISSPSSKYKSVEDALYRRFGDKLLDKMYSLSAPRQLPRKIDVN